MMKNKELYIESEDPDFTGYSFTIFAGSNTGQVGDVIVAPIQGMPFSISSQQEERPESIFPESREERFLDQNLQEFYKKKGYKT